ARASVAPGPFSSVGISRAQTASSTSASAAVSVWSGSRVTAASAAAGSTAPVGAMTATAPTRPACFRSSRRVSPEPALRTSASAALQRAHLRALAPEERPAVRLAHAEVRLEALHGLVKAPLDVLPHGGGCVHRRAGGERGRQIAMPPRRA